MSKAQTKLKKIKNTILITSSVQGFPHFYSPLITCDFAFNYLSNCSNLTNSKLFKISASDSNIVNLCITVEPIWNKPSNNYYLSVHVVNVIIIFVNLLLIDLLASIIIKIQNFQSFEI